MKIFLFQTFSINSKNPVVYGNKIQVFRKFKNILKRRVRFVLL